MAWRYVSGGASLTAMDVRFVVALIMPRRAVNRAASGWRAWIYAPSDSPETMVVILR